jgi:hypothetical protein
MAYLSNITMNLSFSINPYVIIALVLIGVGTWQHVPFHTMVTDVISLLPPLHGAK